MQSEIRSKVTIANYYCCKVLIVLLVIDANDLEEELRKQIEDMD
jgi:uncharacterized protein (DUF952 family)